MNLQAQPRAVWVTYRGKRVFVVAREAVGDERERLWRRFVARYPAAESYGERAGRELPVVVFDRT